MSAEGSSSPRPRINTGSAISQIDTINPAAELEALSIDELSARGYVELSTGGGRGSTGGGVPVLNAADGWVDYADVKVRSCV